MKRKVSIPALLVIICWGTLLALPLVGLALNNETLAGSAEGGGVDWRGLVRVGWNSIWVCGLAALGATAWALLPALVAASWETGWSRGIVVDVGDAPLFVAPSVVALASVHLLGGQGWITSFVARFIPMDRPGGLRFAPIYTLWGGAFAMAWAWLPVVFLCLYTVFRRLDRHGHEVALLETGPVRALLRTAIPGAGAGLLLGVAVLFLLAVADLGVPESLRSLPLLAREVYVQFGVYYDTRGALAAALAGALVALGALGVAMGVVRLAGMGSITEMDADANVEERPAPRGKTVLLLRILAWTMAILPTVTLVSVLFLTLRGPDGPFGVLAQTWKLTNKEFFHSMRLAGYAAALSILAGVIVGMALSRFRNPWPARTIVLLGFILPGPIFGMGTKLGLLWPPGSLPLGADDWLAWLDGTVVPMLLAWVVQFSPLVALLVDLQMRRAPREWTEAVVMESASIFAPFRTWCFWWILPAVAVGGLGVFALSLGEIGATVLLVPPGTTTLSVRLFTLMHYAPVGQVSALCLLMTLPALAVLPVMFWLFSGGSLGKTPIPAVATTQRLDP
ncbi:MAG: iron ABC transporter permease [Candidatus Sumerlaeia bacterium]|nr:iron ABC transporter permease [Candidatus Sumerlaeia bacterium]